MSADRSATSALAASGAFGASLEAVLRVEASSSLLLSGIFSASTGVALRVEAFSALAAIGGFAPLSGAHRSAVSGLEMHGGQSYLFASRVIGPAVRVVRHDSDVPVVRIIKHEPEHVVVLAEGV